VICGIDYVHLKSLAPSQDMLDLYKKQKGSWSEYERAFLDLMESRHIAETTSRDVLDGGCLLCSEEKPTHCHRRLVAEYLADRWEGVQVTHLR